MRSSTFNCLTLLVITAVTAVVSAPALHAQSVSPDVTTYLNALVDDDHIQGISIARIGADGSLSYVNKGTVSGAGSAAVDEHTLFEVGSITKPFTALLLARMVQEQTVALDDPISRYLPDSISVPLYEDQPITLRHLATHTSGLPSLPSNFNPANPLDPYADLSYHTIYAFLDDFNPPRAPASAVMYSNLGMGLLAHILERAANRPYSQLIRDYITEPLAMKETMITVSASDSSRFAAPFKGEQAARYWNFGALQGAGALRSTTADLARFLQAQVHPEKRPLAEAIRRTQTPQYDAGPNPTDAVGLGWFLSTESDSLWWHNGGTGGFKSFAGFEPATGQAIVILSSGQASMDDLGFHLLNNNHPLPEVKRSAARPDSVLRQYTGTYQLAPGFAITIQLPDDGGPLHAQATGQQSLPIYAKQGAEQRFFYKAVEAEIVFKADSTGAFSTLTLYQNGRELQGTKQ